MQLDYTPDTQIVFTKKSNPKRDGSKAHARYSKYMSAKTVQDYFDLGGLKADLKYDYEKGFITFK